MQLSIFESSRGVPSFMQSVLSTGATLAVSVSGGKDSDAMLRYLVSTHSAEGWTGELFSLFCDLGRIEWPGVSEHLHKVCAELDVPITKLYPKRSMIDEWQHRHETILSKQQEKPFWSSSAARYCTKHEKTQPADKRLRAHQFVVCAIGLRAEESSARAKKPRYQVRNDIASIWYKTPQRCKRAEEKERWAEQAYQKWIENDRKGRFALSWHPIHDWSLAEVWQQNGTSCEDIERRSALYQSGELKQALQDFPCHWAYVSSNSRLSCSLCVLASSHDILNGSQHNLHTWIELALMEAVSGWSFQQGRWLLSLASENIALSLTKEKRLRKVLCDLQLVRPVNPLFLLSLICTCKLAQLAFWTEEAVVAISHQLRICSFLE